MAAAPLTRRWSTIGRREIGQPLQEFLRGGEAIIDRRLLIFGQGDILAEAEQLGLAYAAENSGAVLVYHTDGLGSVRAVTDGTGQVVQTYRTDEFGVPVEMQGSSNQPFQYTGEQRDAESGFVYLRARLYDPSIRQLVFQDRSTSWVRFE